jgi:cell division protease FtsH
MNNMTLAMEHCQRPWWKRPPFRFIVIAAALLFVILALEHTDRQASTPYSTFLDQLDAGNVASVTIQGTEINGHYKRPLDGPPLNGTKVQRDTFNSRAPDFGDPTLISELRKQHVVIDINSPSQWTSLLLHLPWPMLLFLVVALLAGLFRLMRGGKMQSGSVASSMPAHGIVGLISNLFAKREQAPNTPTNDSDDKHR